MCIPARIQPPLCALPAHKAYAGFALDGDSLYFTDGETIYCAAPPYDAVESVGYLPSLDTSARLPALMVDNCYCVCNAELGFSAACSSIPRRAAPCAWMPACPI